MKLSEAIRAGAKLRPQAFGVSIDEHGGSCAMTAAREALFGGQRADTRVILAAVGLENEPQVVMPVEVRELVPIVIAVICLNDAYKWTREQIADWLEGIGY